MPEQQHAPCQAYSSATGTTESPPRRTRRTWVDLDNGRCTRNPDLRDAWKANDVDLVAVSPPVDVDPKIPDTDLFVAALRPWWLNSPDGTTSYSDLLFRLSTQELQRAQRDHALDCHESSDQHTLLAAAHNQPTP